MTDELSPRFAEALVRERVEARLAEVHAEIAATGTYRHTTAELTFGARVAWRNSSRCIGRLYWRSLKVRDQREVSAPADVAAECVEHLRVATNKGKIRPVITIFAPAEPAKRKLVLSELHAAIQDRFHSAGVQIMSPNYRGDPAQPKIPRSYP